MAQQRKLPQWSRSELEELIQNLTDAEIAAPYGANRVAVQKLRASFKPPIENPRRRRNYRKLIPWTTAQEHLWDQHAKMLRFDARHRTGGDLTEMDQRQLAKWWHTLDDPKGRTTSGRRGPAVVAYTRERGHFTVPRAPDDEGYVRRP